ncbi:hypothetical protein L202_03966 [Cryptococcus amylolentus CBS 6039]|uniref:N-acetyltransferase domain-containing protein n=1 Tax=Cryptococcus amylolentus CBS 6039 TaxID=1295533 RepID=A0A1E3HPR8_9TREE|nr:hypothetical protein L202_03966 [Cryptococcus amylolentus CBS 6039]ODN78322.1 hypothetical protein L202_03966 [Cryptococcus amylolentus CBS 6039]
MATATPTCPIVVDTDGSAYIPLPDHPGLRLAPRQTTDLDALVKLYNTPEIGKWFWRRPFPYPAEEISKALEKLPVQQAYLATLISSLPTPPAPLIPYTDNICPFNTLREADTGKLLGTVFLGPYETEGDWWIAYDLSPEVWGKGVGSAVAKAAVDYLRWFGAKRVTGVHEPENGASGAVLRKAGFSRVGDKELEWPEEKGGGHRLVHVWEATF